MQQLAQRAKLSLSALDNLENGRSQPLVDVAGRLAEAFNVDIEQIIWLKPGGTSRPPTRLFRTFEANVQQVMAQAVFRVVNYNEPLSEVLEWVKERLYAIGTAADVIEAAIARVQEVVVEDSYRKKAKNLEAEIRARCKVRRLRVT